jgi:hypothetical protein
MSGLVEEFGRELHTRENRSLVVCETSFGAGHSAALFLDTSPYTKVHSFDSFNQPQQQLGVNELKKRYGSDRLVIHPGKSWQTVVNHLIPVKRNESDVQCDFLHSTSWHPSDSIDLVKRSPCGVILTSKVMRTLLEVAAYFGPKAQWTKLRSEGCIRDITCFEEDPAPTVEDLSNYTGKSSKSTGTGSKFCMAVTTGACQEFGRQSKGLTDKECDTQMAEISQRIQLNFLCPAYVTSTPHVIASGKKTTRQGMQTKKAMLANKKWAQHIIAKKST